MKFTHEEIDIMKEVLNKSAFPGSLSGTINNLIKKVTDLGSETVVTTEAAPVKENG